MTFYTLMYIFFPQTSHRMIGYFEDEAVKSYTEYLELVENGKVENIKAPKIAIQYYSLSPKAKLSDLIKCVRADEMHHAEVNHSYADDFTNEDSPSSRTSNLRSIEKRKIA